MTNCLDTDFLPMKLLDGSMTRSHLSLIRISIVIAFMLIAACDDATGEGVDKVATKSREGVVASLQIRDGVKGDSRFMAVIASLRTTDSPCRMQNPFGDRDLGRQYEIVITDNAGQVLRKIVRRTERLSSQLPKELFIQEGGIVGRCHWISIPAFSKETHSLGQAEPKLSPGVYKLVMLVSEDAIVRSRRIEAHGVYQDVEFRSNIVEVHIDSLGVWASRSKDGDHRSQFPEFVPFEATYRLDSSQRLIVSTCVVAPTPAEYVRPFLDGRVSDSTGPLYVAIDSVSGDQVSRFPRDCISSGSIREVSDCLSVPEDGVIGGTRVLSHLEPGSYIAHATFDESYLRSGCFDSGGRLKTVPFWEVLYSSPPVVIHVKDDPQ